MLIAMSPYFVPKAIIMALCLVVFLVVYGLFLEHKGNRPLLISDWEIGLRGWSYDLHRYIFEESNRLEREIKLNFDFHHEVSFNIFNL